MISKLKERLWSLRGTIIRAAIFAVAWGVLPFWLFFLIALYLFFVPPAQAGTIVVPFIVLMGLTLFTPVGFLMVVVFGLLFWYILLIKELYLIDRKVAYETLSLILIFLVFRLFYEQLGAGFAVPASFIFAILIAAAGGFLFSSFVGLFSTGIGDGPMDGARARRLRRVTAGAISFLIFEILLTGLFLPLDFIYQTAITFILTVLTLDLSSRHLMGGSLTRERVLVVSSTAFALLVIMLGSARWGL